MNRYLIGLAVAIGVLNALALPAQAEKITKAEWAKRIDGICAYYNSR
jgi:hypothetical protein